MRGDVDAAYLQAIGVGVARRGGARARGQPARAAARHGLRPPGARPDGHRRRAAGTPPSRTAEISDAAALAGTSAGAGLRGAPRRRRRTKRRTSRSPTPTPKTRTPARRCARGGGERRLGPRRRRRRLLGRGLATPTASLDASSLQHLRRSALDENRYRLTCASPSMSCTSSSKYGTHSDAVLVEALGQARHVLAVARGQRAVVLEVLVHASRRGPRRRATARARRAGARAISSSICSDSSRANAPGSSGRTKSWCTLFTTTPPNGRCASFRRRQK